MQTRRLVIQRAVSAASHPPELRWRLFCLFVCAVVDVLLVVYCLAVAGAAPELMPIEWWQRGEQEGCVHPPSVCLLSLIHI